MRTRSASVTSTRIDPCIDCETVEQPRHWCTSCELLYCDTCWDKLLPHRRDVASKSSALHEKTDPDVANMIKNILRPELTKEDRATLHTNDISTTWFGIVRDERESPLFRDYGQYSRIIAEMKEARLQSGPFGVVAHPDEPLFPSLVSFVGEVGAGKSTVIKLLIDSTSRPGEQFPTPVVGAAEDGNSTSEDVHLYLDPDSSDLNSQAPRLFADCEGLNGGGREPIATRIRKQIEEKQESQPDSRRHPYLRHVWERELSWAQIPGQKYRSFAVAEFFPRLLYTFSDVIVFVVKEER